MMFISRPVKYISTMANRTERGMLTPTTRVGLRSFRKMASTMMASAAPTSILLMMLLTMMVM